MPTRARWLGWYLWYFISTRVDTRAVLRLERVKDLVFAAVIIQLVNKDDFKEVLLLLLLRAIDWAERVT